MDFLYNLCVYPLDYVCALPVTLARLDVGPQTDYRCCGILCQVNVYIFYLIYTYISVPNLMVTCLPLFYEQLVYMRLSSDHLAF